MQREEKQQRIATLLADLQDKLLDLAFLKERVEHTTNAAKQYYQNELRKEQGKLDKIREELTRLGAKN
jgi:hypothetical protein